MSKRLTYEVGASRHPLLMDDRVARDVLWWMANAARESNGCRIIETVETFAHRCDRSMSVVRDAQKRLKKAGLIEERGRGDFNARVIVYTIAENVLIDSPRTDIGEKEEESTPRNDSGSGMLTGASIVGESWANREGIVRESWANREGIVSPTRARALNMNEEQEQPKENASAPAAAHAEGNGEAKPYTLPTHPVADAMLARVNAANALNRAALATRPGPLAPKVEPEPVPEVEPEPAPEQPAAPKPKSPGEQRLDAAVVELMAHIAPTGQTEATLDKWRARLRSRLKAKGVSAEAIADRSQAVRKAWAYIRANGWHQANKRSTPGHFFGVTLRDDATLDRDAANTPRAHGFGAPAPKPWAMVGANTAPAEPEQVAESLPLDLFEAPAPAPKQAPVAPRPAPERAAPESAARLFNAVLGKGAPRT